MITETEGELKINWWTPEEIPRLVELLQLGYPDEKWTVRDLRKFAIKHTKRKNVMKTLRRADQTIFGVLLYTFNADVICRIRRVVVCPEHRRKGFGTFLVNSLTGSRSPLKAQAFQARVRESNTIGQLFLSKGMGFNFDAQVERAKTEDGEDYYVFTYGKQPCQQRSR